MPNLDNKLRKAKNLGLLGSSPLSKGDRVSLTDLDDLYRFSLNRSSSLDISLAKVAKSADVDVEVYALKLPFNLVERSIGNIDFRKLQRGDRNANLRLVGALKGSQAQKTLGNLGQGDYVLRVLQRKGNSAYQFKLVASLTALPDASPTVSSVGSANLFTNGGGSYDFTVTYSDDVAIDVTSLDDNDVRVTGPNGFSQLATRVAITDSSNGSPRTVTYRIAAPGGTWDSIGNGNYNIALQGNQVRDSAGNSAAASNLSSFSVNIAEPPLVDAIAPTASVNVDNLLAGGGTTYDFQVTYEDNVAVDVSSLDNFDTLVTGPNGFSQLATRVNITDGSNGTPRTVTYRVSAPGGTWNAVDNGVYNIALQGNQVRDSAGNFAAASNLSSFLVNIGQPPVIDTIVPTAIINGASSPVKGNNIYEFTVTYSDNVAIDVSSLDNNDIFVTGPNGYSTFATLTPLINNNNGAVRSATYRIPAPVATWDSTDNGTYAIALRPNQVRDISGNFVQPSTLRNRQVNLAPFRPEPQEASSSAGGNGGPAYFEHSDLPFNLSARAELQSDGSVLFRGGIQNAVIELIDSYYDSTDDERYTAHSNLYFTSADIRASRISNSDFNNFDELFGFDFEPSSLTSARYSGADDDAVVADKYRAGGVNGGVGGVKYEITFKNSTRATLETRVILEEGQIDYIDVDVPFNSTTNEYVFPLSNGQEKRISFVNNPIRYFLFVPYPNTDPTDKATFLDSLSNIGANVNRSNEPNPNFFNSVAGVAVGPGLFHRRITVGHSTFLGETEFGGFNEPAYEQTSEVFLRLNFP